MALQRTEPPDPNWLPVQWVHDDHVGNHIEVKKAITPVSETSVWAAKYETPALGDFSDVPAVEEVSGTTTRLLEATNLHGSHASLKRWFAWALEQHQEATHRHIERQHADLKVSLEQIIANRLARRAQPTTHQSPSLVSSKEDSGLNQPICQGPVPGSTESIEVGNIRKRKVFPAPDLGKSRRPASKEEGTDLVRGGQRVYEIPCVDIGAMRSIMKERMPSCFKLWSAVEDFAAAARRNAASNLTARVERTVSLIDATAVVMVFLNMVVICLELERQGADFRVQLDLAGSLGMWEGTEIPLMVVEHVFNSFFLMEVIAKIYLLRSGFLLELTNFIDLAVVTMSTLSLMMSPGFGHRDNILLARCGRFVKVMKVIRVARMAQASQDLRVLMKSLQFSIKALGWSAVFLILIIFIAGLLMAEFVSSFLADCEASDARCKWAYDHYGTASISSWTMFQATLSGCWPQYAVPLVEDINVWFAAFWFLYVVVVWFAVIRILTALFLKQTMEVASSDYELMMGEKIQKKKMYAQRLGMFFKAADSDGDAQITFDEFVKAMDNPSVLSFLQALELDTQEIEQLFSLLDDGDGAISFDEFVGGAVRLKGTATSIDQVSVLHNQGKCLVRLDDIYDRLNLIAQRL